jgi:hypothetical protein
LIVVLKVVRSVLQLNISEVPGLPSSAPGDAAAARAQPEFN